MSRPRLSDGRPRLRQHDGPHHLLPARRLLPGPDGAVRAPRRSRSLPPQQPRSRKRHNARDQIAVRTRKQSGRPLLLFSTVFCYCFVFVTEMRRSEPTIVENTRHISRSVLWKKWRARELRIHYAVCTGVDVLLLNSAVDFIRKFAKANVFALGSRSL